jgi:hypothetical protein
MIRGGGPVAGRLELTIKAGHLKVAGFNYSINTI